MPISTSAFVAGLDLNGVPDKISKLRGVLLQDVGKVMSDQRYAEGYRREQLHELFAEARRQLDLIQREAEEKRDTITEWINETTAPETEDPQRELLNLMKQRDAWERVKRQLDHGVSVDQVVDNAVSNKDLSTLGAIQREMPVYRLTSNGPATIGMANAMSKTERAVADLLKGDRGEAERRRLSLRSQWEEVTVALQAGRDHITALEADPAGRLQRAARLADVERNSSGIAIVNGSLQARGSRSGGDFTNVR